MAKKKVSARPPKIPEGYVRVPGECYLKPFHLVWRPGKRCWEPAGKRAKDGDSVKIGQRIVINFPPPIPPAPVCRPPAGMPVNYEHPYQSLQVSVINPKTAQELVDEQEECQRKIEEAKREGKTEVEILGTTHQIYAGPLGSRGCAGGTLWVEKLAADDVDRYLREHPELGLDNSLDCPVEGLTRDEQVLYARYLKHLPEAQRQRLFAIGGMKAVREAALKLVRAALQPKTQAKPRRKPRV